MNQLPAAWEETTLESVSDIIRGITFPASAKEFQKGDANVCCLRTTNVQREIEWDDVYFVSRDFVKRNEQFVNVGDILMSMANSYELVGKVAVVKTLPYETAYGAFLSAVRPRGVTTGQYLFYFLRSDHVQRTIREGSSQTTNIANVSIATLSKIPMPLAPLPEQQRIADKLDSLLSRVDSCRERLERIPAILKRFRQSVLAAATSGKLTEDWREENGVDSDWDVKPLSELVSGLEQGWSPKCENYPSPSSERWGVIKTTAIQELRFDETENKALPASLEPRPRFELQAGDILITRAGPRIRCGVACYVPMVRPKLMLCDKAYRFQAFESLVRAEYVATALNAPAVVVAIDKLKTGISESGMNLTQTKFKELEIPCPSIDEQDEILRRVRDLFSFANNVEMQHQNACRQVNRLTPSILAKAFRGELVPQDPNDEPASVLLERIRAAKPDTKKKTSRRKAKAK